MIDESIGAIVHDFGTGRAIAAYAGAYVMVDALPEGWALSSEPARPGAELATLNVLVKALASMGTVVTVTPPEEA